MSKNKVDLEILGKIRYIFRSFFKKSDFVGDVNKDWSKIEKIHLLGVVAELGESVIYHGVNKFDLVHPALPVDIIDKIKECKSLQSQFEIVISCLYIAGTSSCINYRCTVFYSFCRPCFCYAL